ncbi:hypothetical protein [Mesorhizobium sp. M2A.F.Ca.ET.067.02.1.1]|uniref:hypothetical protein n=1 Tax=Mesorhizobium sp. M2A.F.Ca.ET.067.02.1.1 TaxID=2496749 RepID=UPI000FD1A260|nr:hypothetical protein [Mesorhizobium sp. M2A.F.Ca.ET.067.02.1.1]RUW69831.1 hypothetical protein EOA28_24785 [Mesorhizobium sp. M2A.F.Ca.ET.067.02.1.1]
MTSRAKLKPCPFDHPIRNGSAIEPINNHFHGICRDCGAQGPEAEKFAEALVLWNARRRSDGSAKQ